MRATSGLQQHPERTCPRHRLNLSQEERQALREGEEEDAMRIVEASEAPRLEGACASVLGDLLPTHSSENRQNRLIQRLEHILQDMYGLQAKLAVFGSTTCNLAGRSSDLDMTFTPGFAKRLSLGDKKSQLRKISKVLQSNGMLAVPILGARIPIVKIKDKDTWLSVDLSVENELPVFKSRLLHEYSQIDERLSKLVLLVKAWARARNINCAAQGIYRPRVSGGVVVRTCGSTIHSLIQV